MSSANSNNDEPNRGGRGGRARGRGRRGGKKKAEAAAAGSTEWMTLDPQYREWLVSAGIAANAAAFHKLSTQDRLAARAGYKAEMEKDVEMDLKRIIQMNMITQMDPYEAISESHSSAQDSAEARTASIAYYGLPGEKFCQILGPQPEHVKITNAHIWPRRATASLPLFDLKTEDIHNPRNVLRLQQCIERAFDRKELTIVADADGRLVLKVLSEDLLKPTSALLKGTQKQFADIDGAPLQILNTGNLPYRRLLANHSVLAHKKAREKTWISGDLAAEEVNAGALREHSLDREAQDRLKLMWRKNS